MATIVKYDPSQPRDEDGKWTDGGGAGASSPGSTPKNLSGSRTAAFAGTGLLALGAIALAARNPAVVANAVLGGSRAVDRYTGNAVNRAMFGGGGILSKPTVGTVSRSKLEAGPYRLVGSNADDVTNALNRRFGDASVAVKHNASNGAYEITVKSKALTDAVINSMHSSGSTALIKNGVYLNLIVNKKLGNIVLVNSLYAPDTAMGRLFTQKAFTTIRDIAVANKADAVVTPAGWSMGGYLWPNAGFQLLGAGTAPYSIALRAAGTWDETHAVAEALRYTIRQRAKELHRANIIDKPTRIKILTQLTDKNWGPDSAVKISNMKTKVNLGNTRLMGMPKVGDLDMRGDSTLGKVLLIHTNGNYVLPKHLYERMFTVTKAANRVIIKTEEAAWKGNGMFRVRYEKAVAASPWGSFQPKPKRRKLRAGRVALTSASNISTAPASMGKASFLDALVKYDPSQPRDESGRWTDGGGGGSRSSGRTRERLDSGSFDGGSFSSTSRTKKPRRGSVEQTNQVTININRDGTTSISGGGRGGDGGGDGDGGGGPLGSGTLSTQHEVAPGVTFSSTQTGRAALIGAGLAVGAGLLARNPKLLQQGYQALRNLLGSVTTQTSRAGGKPVYTLRVRKPKTPAAPKAPPAASAGASTAAATGVRMPKPTKPLHEMSARQQARYKDSVIARIAAANPRASQAKIRATADAVMRSKISQSAAAAASGAKTTARVGTRTTTSQSKPGGSSNKPKTKTPKAKKPKSGVPGLGTMATIGATMGGAAAAAVRNPVARQGVAGGAAGAAGGALVPQEPRDVTPAPQPSELVTPSRLTGATGDVRVPSNLSLSDQARFVDTVSAIEAANARLAQIATRQANLDARFPTNRGMGSSYRDAAAGIAVERRRVQRERARLLEELEALRGRTTKRVVKRERLDKNYNWGPVNSVLRGAGYGIAGLGAAGLGLGFLRGAYERALERYKDNLPAALNDPNLPQHIKDAIRNRVEPWQSSSWDDDDDMYKVGNTGGTPTSPSTTAHTFEEAMAINKEKEDKKKATAPFRERLGKANGFRRVDGKFTTAPDGAAPTTRGVPLLTRGQEAVDLLRTNLKGHPTPTTREFVSKLPSEHRAYIREKLKALHNLPPTDALVKDGGFKNEQGEWVPKRKALHEVALNTRLLDAISRAMPEPGEPPVLCLVGGRPGSGKTTVLHESGLVPDMDAYLYVNADDLRGDNKQFLEGKDKRFGLPGYEGWNSVLYHKEASELAKCLTKLGMKRKLNILHDATMKNPQALLALIETAKSCGYVVKGLFVHARPAVAARRAIDRAVGKPNGRFVPGYLLGNTVNEESFDATKHLMDKWFLYDVNGKTPKLVAKGTKANTEQPHPHLWSRHFPEVVNNFEGFGKFDENQPRDKDGKWTDGGGVGRSIATGAAGAALGTLTTLALIRAGQGARVANRAARIADAAARRRAAAETAALDARLAQHMNPRGPVSRTAARVNDAIDRGLVRMAGTKPGKRVRLAVRRKLPKKLRERLREFSRPGIDFSGGGKFPGDWIA